MDNDLTAPLAPVKTDPEAVFAALEKVIAETPLPARTRTGGVMAEPTVGAAAQAAPGPQPEIVEQPADTANAEQTHTTTLPPIATAARTASTDDPPPQPDAHPAWQLPVFLEPAEQKPGPRVVDNKAAMHVVRPGAEPAQGVVTAPLWQRPVGVALILLSIVVVLEAAFLVWDRRDRTPIPGPSAGSVAVESTPAGAAIVINGRDFGTTPATLTLRPGDYTMEITSGGVSERLPLRIQAGISSTQHVHFAGTAGAGTLKVSSLPAGARITIDGAVRGVTPLSLSDLGPGAHAIVVEALAAPPPSSATGGWVSVTAPIDVQLFESGALLGSSQSSRIMLPAGRHVIDVVNTTLGYQTTQTVQIGAGAVSKLTLDVPKAAVAINAVPWAEVSIDGKTLGPTPLGNVQVPIGSHEVVFRHPQLGERRQTAVVTVKGPNRISANLNQR